MINIDTSNLNSICDISCDFYLIATIILVFIYLINKILIKNKKKNNNLNYIDLLGALSFSISFLTIIIMLIESGIVNYLFIWRIPYLENEIFNKKLIENTSPLKYLEDDLFGIILIFLSSYSIKLSKSMLSSRSNINNIDINVVAVYFMVVVNNFISTDDFIEFFFYYELLLLPSFLILYFIGYSRRSINGSIYFLLWTQSGALLILLCFIIFNKLFSITSFSEIETLVEKGQGRLFIYNLIVYLLVLGFGVKIPIWPFHYWITKTHVEAPSGFSIYLSGFLVKSALFGLYKTLFYINSWFNLYPLLCLIVLGFFDSSIKFWSQTDLKKLVAYCTIQEMNLLILIFIFGNSKLVYTGVLFVLTHGLLSCLMFFLVDLIYKRYLTRSTTIISGLLVACPNLSLIIIIMQLCFVGIPGTIKFLVEFNLFTSISLSFPFLTILLIIINLVASIGFSKVWYNTIFGIPPKNPSIVMDINLDEIILIIPAIIYQFILTILYNYTF